MDENSKVLQWERQQNESEKWFVKFKYYLALGVNRSVYAAYQKSARKPKAHAPSSWKKTAQKWKWQERAQAWDEHNIGRIHLEMEERRTKEIEAEIEDGMRLRNKARQILDELPIKILKGDDGVLMMPASSTEFNAASRMMMDGIKILRLAYGMPNEAIKVDLNDWRTQAKMTGVNPKIIDDQFDNMVDAVATRIARGDETGDLGEGA